MPKNQPNNNKNWSTLCAGCKLKVKATDGVQCQGPCAKWRHYHCLDAAACKIHAMKTGEVVLRCPCPNCEPAQMDEKSWRSPCCKGIPCPMNNEKNIELSSQSDNTSESFTVLSNEKFTGLNNDYEINQGHRTEEHSRQNEPRRKWGNHHKRQETAPMNIRTIPEEETKTSNERNEENKRRRPRTPELSRREMNDSFNSPTPRNYYEMSDMPSEPPNMNAGEFDIARVDTDDKRGSERRISISTSTTLIVETISDNNVLDNENEEQSRNVTESSTKRYEVKDRPNRAHTESSNLSSKDVGRVHKSLTDVRYGGQDLKQKQEAGNKQTNCICIPNTCEESVKYAKQGRKAGESSIKSKDSSKSLERLQRSLTEVKSGVEDLKQKQEAVEMCFQSVKHMCDAVDMLSKKINEVVERVKETVEETEKERRKSLSKKSSQRSQGKMCFCPNNREPL